MPGVCGILQAANEKNTSQSVAALRRHTRKHAPRVASRLGHGSHKSGHKPKKGKKDKADKDDKHGAEDDKPCRSPSKSSGKAASEEQSPGTLRCSRHLAGSTSRGGHHKKSKKCGKKKSHRKSH